MSEEFMYGLMFYAGVAGFYLFTCWSARREERQERDVFDDGGER